MKISFVIPCYHSSLTLHSVVAEIGAVMSHRPEYDYEIVLVNDGSLDDTFEVIRTLCAEDNRVKGFNLTKNFGQPNATLAGLAHATGDLIVYSDDDGQSPVDEVWCLIDKIKEGHDLVFAKYKSLKSGIFQRLGSKLNDFMANILLGKPKSVHMGSFWIARKYVTDELVNCNNPYPYLAGLFLKTTSNIANVPTEHKERSIGKSNYTFFKMLSLWLNGFTAFSVVPLRLATVLGASCSIVGFFYVIVIIAIKLRNPAILIGYSSLMATILFASGIIMLILGMIGEYVGRIYMNINKIPQYVVKEKINVEEARG